MTSQMRAQGHSGQLWISYSSKDGKPTIKGRRSRYRPRCINAENGRSYEDEYVRCEDFGRFDAFPKVS